MPGAEEQEKEEECALFATSAPRDIWANPSLAAIAALIDEDEEQKEESRRGMYVLLLSVVSSSFCSRGYPPRLGDRVLLRITLHVDEPRPSIAELKKYLPGDQVLVCLDF